MKKLIECAAYHIGRIGRLGFNSDLTTFKKVVKSPTYLSYLCGYKVTAISQEITTSDNNTGNQGWVL